MVKRKIIWGLCALETFQHIIAYIKKDSVQNAEKVKKDILSAIRSLITEPEKIHAADKYKINNDGNFRAFELHRVRISYYISDDCIQIVRVRHTRKQPEIY